MDEKHIKKSVNHFNKTLPKGNYLKNYKFSFGLTYQVAEKMDQGKLFEFFKYIMNQCVTLYQFLPHELVLHEFDRNGEEGGVYTFYFWCR